jgi:SAM-dependent methyltransferase
MLDLVKTLAPGSRVLDLGAGGGSFPSERSDLKVVRVDLRTPVPRASGVYAVADAAELPFISDCFDLAVSNHSLEHFLRLEETVREIGRVLRAGGVFYVAVPDATTLTDRIYRWLARGGGHVNAFRSPEEVVGLVERLTGLPHRTTRVLYSSLSFLNAHNFVTRPPRKIALFAFGHEGFLAVFTWILRVLDRVLGTRLSQYGWTFHFGGEATPAAAESWVNVCVRCGSGHSEAYLRKSATMHRAFVLLQTYRCPACGGFNLLTPEQPTRPAIPVP